MLQLRPVRILAAAALAATLQLAAANTRALTVEGHDYADSVTVANETLKLNGAGLRWKFWFKGFTAGLWVEHPSKDVATVLDQSGPKRLRIRVLVNVDSVEFAKAFDAGIQKNHPPAEVARMAPRMKQFDDVVLSLGKLRRDEAIDMDWLPGRGIQLLRDGQATGPLIQGEDLYRALLKIFIGERPAQEELKRALLSPPAT